MAIISGGLSSAVLSAQVDTVLPLSGGEADYYFKSRGLSGSELGGHERIPNKSDMIKYGSA